MQHPTIFRVLHFSLEPAPPFWRVGCCAIDYATIVKHDSRSNIYLIFRAIAPALHNTYLRRK